LEEIMSVITGNTRSGTAVTNTATGATEETLGARTGRQLAAITRISLGWVFLWAFVDKLFGLGFATKAGKGWLDGGHPTEGFLKNGVKGPFKDFYADLAGQAWVDWLFMIGLAGIGISLFLGIGMRVAAASGALLLLMMFTATLQPDNNPFVDDHIVYALVLGVLALTGAGRTFGFGKQWERLPIVQRFPFLK
jgi:thiosulfate dehydrogenase (quinone) large subunit